MLTPSIVQPEGNAFNFFWNHTQQPVLNITQIRNPEGFKCDTSSPYALHLTNVTPEMEMMLDQAFMTSVRAGDFPIQVTWCVHNCTGHQKCKGD